MWHGGPERRTDRTARTERVARVSCAAVASRDRAAAPEPELPRNVKAATPAEAPPDGSQGSRASSSQARSVAWAGDAAQARNDAQARAGSPSAARTNARDDTKT